MSSNLKDKRFTNIGKDPRFRRVPTKTKKVTVDNRFSGMFKDKRFKLEYLVDKRGRPVKASSNEQLKDYYDLHSESSDDESQIVEVAEEKPKPTSSMTKSTKPKTVNGFQVSEMSSESDEDNPAASDTELPTDVRTKLLDIDVNYARGEGALFSDSSSEEYSSEEDDEDEDLIHDWGELDKDSKRTDTSTSRLAVCNMDWDRIRAVDLMILLNSFAPQGSTHKLIRLPLIHFCLPNRRLCIECYYLSI